MNGNGNRILAVDDSTTNNILLEAVLENLGYNIKTVMNARDALTSLEKEQFDLIVLDLLMPGTNGFDFLNSIKSNQKHKDIPVIVVTAANDEKNKNMSYELGAADFIEKPIDINNFVTTIANHIKK